VSIRIDIGMLAILILLLSLRDLFDDAIVIVAELVEVVALDNLLCYVCCSVEMWGVRCKMTTDARRSPS
jgi:hypothetical protein